MQASTFGAQTGWSEQHHADPGMMERRLLFKSFGGLALDTLKFPFSDVAVVLGDPSKPSGDKLNGTWNPEVAPPLRFAPRSHSRRARRTLKRSRS